MPDPLINQRLGKYLIHQEIGRGGMARVYRATDTVLQRIVAIKILAPQLGSDPEFAQRFEREAITAANLRHAAIITIFDVGEVNGLRYIAMEYIAGRTVAEVLQERGKLDLSLTIGVLAPVAEALEYAHSVGAVHRDVKPQNIMVDTNGRVVLTDFGIAVGPSQVAQKLTQAGTFLGTPEYISPEQAQAQRLTGRSDQYSLGIVSYELVTGEVPFTGALPRIIMAHVYDQPESVSARDPMLPRELDGVFAHVLAKEPAQRFERTTDLVEALRHVAQHHGVTPATRAEVATLAVPRDSSAGKATMVLNAEPTSAAAAPPLADEIAQVFGKAKAPAPVLPGAPRQSAPAPPTAPANAPPATPQRKRTPRQPLPSPRAQSMARTRSDGSDLPPRRRPFPTAGSRNVPWAVIVAVVVGLAVLGLLFARPSRSRRSPFGSAPTAVSAAIGVPALETPSSTPPVLSGATQPQPTPVPTWTPAPPPTATPAPSPTPEPVVVAEPPPDPTATPEPVPEPPTAPPPTDTVEPTATPEPSPTEPPTPTATVEALPPVDEARPSAAAPSPTESEAGAVATPIGGGGRIVAISGPHLTMFDVVQNESFVIQGNVDASGPAAFSPDGELVLFDDSDGIFRTIFAYDTVSGAVEELGIVDEAYHPAWSPDGSHIVLVTTANGNPDLAVVDLEGSGELEILDPDPATDEYPSFSPDGSQILFESDRAGSPALYLLDAAGVYPFSEPNQGWADRYGRFSPDGSTIAFASSRDRSDGATEIYVQPVVGGPARRLTSFGSGNASGPTWSPDGRLLAFFSDAAGNNDIYVVRVDNGQVIQITNGPEDERWPVWGP